jgi:hypothetical protein
MKLRHAAALALVGWYLMVPPIENGQLNLHAPVSRWEIESSYDRADDCQRIIARFVQMYPHLKDEGSGFTKAKAWPMVNAKCIATDDPRLKETP